MNAGKLRHKITLQNRISTQNPVGGRDYSFVDVPGLGNLWASYEASRPGLIYFGGDEAYTEGECIFTIRYSDLPQPGMYLIYKGVQYLVVAANDTDGSRRWLQLSCRREG